MVLGFFIKNTCEVKRKFLLDENGIQRSITRISYEINRKKIKQWTILFLVGIKNRGDILAEELKKNWWNFENVDIH